MTNDKSQHLKGPEYATAIGLLMESLKIRDKKNNPEKIEEKAEVKTKLNTELPTEETVLQEIVTKEELAVQTAEKRRNKLTIGQKIMESVKKFFEEVE